jgi:hypothetical protein
MSDLNDSGDSFLFDSSIGAEGKITQPWLGAGLSTNTGVQR